MRRFMCSTVLAFAMAAAGVAAQQDVAKRSADPRVGLKAGLHDAGEAIENMERVASMSKPDGFFDPKNPAGPPTPPEKPGQGLGLSGAPDRVSK